MLADMNNNPFSSKGTMGRLFFFLTTLICFAIEIACFIFNEFYKISLTGNPLPFYTVLISGLISLLTIVVFINCFIKRLRDVKRSTKWLFLWLVPILPLFLWIYLIFKKGLSADKTAE